ncbi:hypothetical protein ACWGB8_36780 [Kitasatospora sp. NPDC054939]
MAEAAGVMQSITFAAWRDDPLHPGAPAHRRYVTLAELLVLLGGYGLGLTWQVRIYDPPTGTVSTPAPGGRIATLDLLAGQAPHRQHVDADFHGYAGEELVVVFQEFDSTSWDVRSRDERLLAHIRGHYPDAGPTSDPGAAAAHPGGAD